MRPVYCVSLVAMHGVSGVGARWNSGSRLVAALLLVAGFMLTWPRLDIVSLMLASLLAVCVAAFVALSDPKLSGLLFWSHAGTIVGVVVCGALFLSSSEFHQLALHPAQSLVTAREAALIAGSAVLGVTTIVASVGLRKMAPAALAYLFPALGAVIVAWDSFTLRDALPGALSLLGHVFMTVQHTGVLKPPLLTAVEKTV